MSMFATKNTSAEAVENLVTNLEKYIPGGIVSTEALKDQGILYSRAWLILRRAWLEANDAKRIVAPSKAALAKAQKSFGDQADWELRHVWGPLVVAMHDEELDSWGEIMVRLGKSEGFVRKAYRLSRTGEVRDLGLRTGKGGRFVADRPDLYLENRKAEGAVIPQVERPRTVAIESLLNYQPAEG